MKIHCIGIGGIGVSALARYYLARGDEITGSDLGQTEIIEDLEKLGAKIKLADTRPVMFQKTSEWLFIAPPSKMIIQSCNRQD